MKCIEDEIPFELPEGWEWTRLGCITDVIQYGFSNSAESTGDYRFLRITDIQNGCVNWDTVPFTCTDEPEKYLLHKDDIVFARTGATVGKSFLITDLPYASVYASYLIRIRLINGISANYIYHFFNSYCYWEQVTDKAVGVGQPNCNGTALRELFIPLPSQAEQNRIVPVADNLLKILNTITSEQESLSELIQTTKSKILDLAIRGKLVPQDPNDEPASVLLECIQAEKEELIKQGKIKRDKKESVIFKGDDNSYYEKINGEVFCIDEEIPYDIPDTWTWMRLENCCVKEIRRGKSPKYKENSNVLVFAQKCNTKYNGIDVSLAQYLDETALKRYTSSLFSFFASSNTSRQFSNSSSNIPLYCSFVIPIFSIITFTSVYIIIAYFYINSLYFSKKEFQPATILSADWNSSIIRVRVRLRSRLVD